ncbi:hypothetical protein SAMN04488698_10899 [Candidatus Frackibacter sp. WG12]|uniref:hypothetical protein n=1 Tax=unclassified Candidatus Frackibacter TaxID=2648818 RepID=UPI000799C1C0|nr:MULTISPECIES: hypothetical protein [unclassified Candidatus Frackibacter]KXS43795.1 MAG: hypothetical protein AWU54_907 [Candidatus Frackibacter sp. T328-2]SDC40025.1 hypothetical protein SAMN04515661_10921 [Candidatus Frackibacter sp. WG11]SEM60712.1 hypothetical protein SAMN04488698_10899 [Candidatus Frackibacter sp. WG12]
MDKQKLIILGLAVLLLVGLIATNQSNWTPKEESGVSMEQLTGQSGGGQQGGKTSKKSPHDTDVKVETNKYGFPKEVAGVKLNNFLSGQKAIKSIEKLHGTSIDIVDGYVATYGGGQKEVKIWLSEAKTKAKAAEQIKVMTEMIMKNSDVFAKPSVFQVSGTRFFQTKGMGMNNYYYQKGKKAYWISVKGVDEAAIMGLIFKVL